VCKHPGAAGTFGQIPSGDFQMLAVRSEVDGAEKRESVGADITEQRMSAANEMSAKAPNRDPWILPFGRWSLGRRVSS
jgi:hypothetical protein